MISTWMFLKSFQFLTQGVLIDGILLMVMGMLPIILSVIFPYAFAIVPLQFYERHYGKTKWGDTN